MVFLQNSFNNSNNEILKRPDKVNKEILREIVDNTEVIKVKISEITTVKYKYRKNVKQPQVYLYQLFSAHGDKKTIFCDILILLKSKNKIQSNQKQKIAKTNEKL